MCLKPYLNEVERALAKAYFAQQGPESAPEAASSLVLRGSELPSGPFIGGWGTVVVYGR